MWEIYDIEELPEGTFTISFKIIELHQQEDPVLTEKPKCTEYTKGSFHGGRDTIELVTYKEKYPFHRIPKNT